MSDFPAMQPSRYPGQYPRDPYDGVTVDGPVPDATPPPASVPFQSPWSALLGKIPPGAPPQQAAPQADAPNSLDFAHSILAMVNKKALQDGSYDSTEDFNKLQQALLKASAAKSPYELQADNALLQATEENKLADYMKNNPLAPPEQYKAPDSVGLSLPGVPTNVQPHPNGIASLGAGIAGLFAPRAAGRFGAEALSGAIQAAQRENAARREKYQFELQQSLVKHQDAVREADAKARVEAQNTALKNTYSAEQHNDNLKTAVERMNAAVKSGEAGNLRKFIEGDKEAQQSKGQAQFLEQKIKTSSEQAKEALDRAARSAELQLKIDEQKQIAAQRAQERADVLAENVRKDKAAEQQRKDTEAENIRKDRAAERDRQDRIGMENARLSEERRYHDIEHGDRLRGQDLTYQEKQNSSRGSVMHHETPEEYAAKIDIKPHETEMNEARKALAAKPDSKPLQIAYRNAQIGYNRARQNYMDLSNKAREKDRPTSGASRLSDEELMRRIKQQTGT